MDVDLEELSFHLGIILFICALLSVALIYLPNIPFPDFHLFVFSIVSLIASVVCLAVNLIYRWQAQEPYPYPLMREVRGLSAEVKHPQRAKMVNVNPPTREQLQRLKEVLGISQGSLQFKKRGRGIYHVLYNEGKHQWTHIGSWIQLREKLDSESTVE